MKEIEFSITADTLEAGQSLKFEPAMKLIDFLTNQPARFPYTSPVRILPTRLPALNRLAAEGDPFVIAYNEAMQRGRGYPPVRLWGRIEDALTNALANIWEEVLAASEPNLDDILHRHLDELAARLDAVLAS